jgi:predicted enzyme related to lactoylglutathione lyase
MPSDIEWHFASGGLQLVDDSEHAGAGSVTLGVDDFDADFAAIGNRGLDVLEAMTVPSGQFRIAVFRDPDGKIVVLGQTLTS